jgi:hypothetical protein
MRLEGLGKLEKINNLIRNRTRDLLPCIIVPQPNTLPRVPPSNYHTKHKLQFFNGIQMVRLVVTVL